jgi:LAO/AO transport system kinase
LPPDLDVAALAEGVRRGDPRALARAITLIENETDDGRALVASVYPASGGAVIIGVTGPPGAGKSTLVDGFIAHVRRLGLTVGVLAIDPTSPFTGGAILGDRVRMNGHANDEGVFIRSMATRGQLGGLARAAADAAVILDVAGKDVVVIETVGVGQDEVDVAQVVDVAVVVLVPGTGDEVQAIKAGLMEIADVFVVNKADRDGADRMVQAIEMNLSLHPYGEGDWRPPVVKTVATTGDGVEELWRAIGSFRASGLGDVRLRRRRGYGLRLRQLLADRLLRYVERVITPARMEQTIDRVAVREIDIYSAADQILRETIPDAGRPAPGSSTAEPEGQSAAPRGKR